MLTTDQLNTLKADILTHPELDAARQSGDDAALADYYNTNASPDFYVWRTSVTQQEYTNAIGPNSTTFNWAGTGGYIARSQGERDAFRAIFNAGESNSVNPSLANVRAAFDDIFSGSGAGAVNNRTHMMDVSKRKATRLEKLFATGTGSSVSPALMVVEGVISPSEISGAR